MSSQKEKLKKAIEKAVENGWIDNLSPTLSLDWYFEDQGYYGIIFSHKFAKAFWGEKSKKIIGYYYGCTREGWEFDKDDLEPLESLSSDIKKKLLEDGCSYSPNNTCCETYYLATETINEGWQYHLQQMVLSEDPLEYLAQFL